VKTGRPKILSNDGLSVHQWMKTVLSCGSKQANELLEAGELQGFSKKTLRRAKIALDIKSDKQGHVWYWRDPSVAEPEKPKTFQETVLRKLDEVQRRTELPSIVTGNGRTAAPDPNEVDEHGFKTSTPGSSLGAQIAPLQVHAEIKRLVKANVPHEQIVAHIFRWAYPAAGLSESALAQMLRNGGVTVTPRVTHEDRVDF
jgi:hypothetical protein